MSQLNMLIEKGISIAGSGRALAAQIGVPETHISMWRHGKKVCTPRSRVMLAKVAKEDVAEAALEALLDDATREGDEDLAKTLKQRLKAFGQKL
ncbi:DNA-binding transcriptional regulator YdaS (Cro superfamily) [Variovorax boronicumulans]|uniref:hypothetical protein n=1 Tax=Variovorax boronicumulans TaxID=436515 RepID=UPI002781AD00|nr:hypothetical protein [Variovorax boronicumulans]MDP9911872.1 DNA-binding transcriptional regulator YdaS (Cro superfamily) [Variovorax boronicumulans]